MRKKQLIISVIACVIIAIFVSPFLTPSTGAEENTETVLPEEKKTDAEQSDVLLRTADADSAPDTSRGDAAKASVNGLTLKNGAVTSKLTAAGDENAAVKEGTEAAAVSEAAPANDRVAVGSSSVGYGYSFGFTRSVVADTEKKEEPAGSTVILEETGFGENVVLSLLSDADNLTSYIFARAGEADAPVTEEIREFKEDLVSKKLAEIPLPDDVPSSLTYVYNRKFKMNITDYERNILYRIVQAEAGDQDTFGRILVANVVLNRVLDNSYPDDIEGVVFQKIGGSTQFAPTKDGRYYTVTVTSKTINAVDRALRGEDYSNGALYFFQRNLTTSDKASWFDTTLKRLFKYGDHEFYTDKRK